ncbi:uncharacterized protein At2g39795, mitochondrial-like [Aristolochia californica]|uniref:uncharacterized protein At2g39795, mitochondrial-like n=1 Tax=Aristolochia californica TaxID=171875 RepID=UPI0035D60A8F
MAFSRVLCRAVSVVSPFVTRVTGTPTSCRPANISYLLNSVSRELCRGTVVVCSRNFSSLAKTTNSDANLLKVIDSEIKCAEESDDHDRVEEVPGGFPFTIEDNPGDQTITLKREYQGETITVEVHMPDLVTGENDEDDDDDGDQNDDNPNQSSIPLVVSISKSQGPIMEFSVTAFPDEISIDGLSLKEQETSEDKLAYEGPDFADLDENLQKALHKYLEIRGIKPSTTNFLHEYMINKDSREYLNWLQTVKKFVEK